MLTDLDEALERFQQSDFDCGDGSVNEGPMAAVALEALGHPALIPFFTDVYVPRLRPRPSGAPIAPEARARALGDRSLRFDWLATFESLLAESHHEAVLAEWLPVLLPGAFAASGSGLLRTVGALNLLDEGDDVVRRRELAFGLAHWASRHQVLPGDAGAQAQPGRTICDAMGGLAAVASETRRLEPSSEALLALEGDAGYAAGVASVDLEALPVTDAMLELVHCVALLQLRYPESRGAYGQVAKVALGLLELHAHLPGAAGADVVARAAQVALAVHGVHGAGIDVAGQAAVEDAERDALARDVDEIRYRAACSGQDRAITLAEAYLCAHRMRPDPELLRAAADAALRFESAHGGRGG